MLTPETIWTDTEVMHILTIVTTILVAAVGWGVRLVIAQLRQLREELKEFVRRETCRAHREALSREIDELRSMIKFGRRAGDSALASLVQAFNKQMGRPEKETDIVEQGETLQQIERPQD